MLGCRPEVPDHRLASPRQQREADQLVHGPGADVRGRHVADIGEVERQQRSEFGGVQMLPQALQPISAQPVDVDPSPPSRPRSARTCGSPCPPHVLDGVQYKLRLFSRDTGRDSGCERRESRAAAWRRSERRRSFLCERRRQRRIHRAMREQPERRRGAQWVTRRCRR